MKVAGFTSVRMGHLDWTATNRLKVNLILVQSNKTVGVIQLKASSETLKDAEVLLKAE